MSLCVSPALTIISHNHAFPDSTPVELSPTGDYIKKPTWIDEALAAAAAALADEVPTSNATKPGPAASAASKASKASKLRKASAKKDLSDAPNSSTDSDASSASNASAAPLLGKRATTKQSVIKGEDLFGSSEGWNG